MKTLELCLAAPDADSFFILHPPSLLGFFPVYFCEKEANVQQMLTMSK